MIKRGDWSVDLSLNFSNYVNTIIDLDENVLHNYNADFNYSNGSYLNRFQVNNSFGSIYGFRYKGVYQYDIYQPDKPDATAPVVRDANGNVVLDGSHTERRMNTVSGEEMQSMRILTMMVR